MLFGSYGGTMRGARPASTLVVGDAPIGAPPIVSRAWSAIAMPPAYFAAVAAVLVREAVVVSNTSLFREPVAGDRWRVYGIPATQLASECGSALAGALVLVGAYASLTGLVAFDALIAG